MIPEDVIEISREIPHINTKEALYTGIKLWRSIFSDLSILPRPTLKRIIPSTHALWNATMGGSDAITKITDDCILRPPRLYSNFETIAVSRCISNIFATILKLLQLSTAKKDLDFYPSMQHYQNAASHRFTFQTLLLMSADLMKKEVKKLEEGEQEILKEINTNSKSYPWQRKNPSCMLFNSTIPEEMDFAPLQTSKTPQKNRKGQVEQAAGQQKSQVCAVVLDCKHTCTGFPVEVFCQNKGKSGSDARRKCYVCGSKTKWRCIKCRFYYCINTKKANEQSYYYVKEVEKGQGQVTKIYGKSCFHKEHEHAICEHLINDANH